jgi:hypothetical protein
MVVVHGAASADPLFARAAVRDSHQHRRRATRVAANARQREPSHLEPQTGHRRRVPRADSTATRPPLPLGSNASAWLAARRAPGLDDLRQRGSIARRRLLRPDGAGVSTARPGALGARPQRARRGPALVRSHLSESERGARDAAREPGDPVTRDARLERSGNCHHANHLASSRSGEVEVDRACVIG